MATPATTAAPTTTAATITTYQVSPPETFNFSQPQEWPKWARRFERFRTVSGLMAKEEVIQVNTLIYSMGDEADDILRSFDLSDVDKRVYRTVKEKFDSHFVKKRNVIFERAKFNMRKQETGEGVDNFITDLYALAEHCGYGTLHDQMIRDRLVVGLKDARLSEKLQLDAELTLEKAITNVRQAEAVRQQQPVVRGDEGHGAAIGFVRKEDVRRKKGHHNKNTKGTSHQKYSAQQSPSEGVSSSCHWCGKVPSHGRQHCPARAAVCGKCGKKGHYQRVCKSAKVGGIYRLPDTKGSESSDTIFLGCIGEKGQNPWMVNLKLNGHSVRFQIDTGAEVTVVPEHLLKKIPRISLQPSDRTLRGPSRNILPAKGQFRATVKIDSREAEQDVYVVSGLHQPLLGRPAIEALGLVSRIQAIQAVMEEDKHPKNLFPELFSGLGKLEKEYTIKLKEGVVPFALNTPRRVAIPLMPAVQEELTRMENLGVISRVEEPTDWCAGMVVVPKPDGRVRICVDLTKLNESVCRERHMMPAVEQTLAQVKGAQVFSKLDANSGFWQIPLSKESALLTSFITPFGRFCFNRLPFGITSAPEHFQRRMSSILAGLKGVVCQMDDILIYGKDQQEHDERLHAVLQRLKEAGITLNREKCVFSQKSVKFLGQVLTQSGVQSDPDKVAAIRKMKEPENVSEIRRFLGMANQLSKFTPHLANMTKPLRDLLSKENLWHWGQSQKEAFASVQEALTKSPVLALYDPSLKTTVSADASSYGLGAVLRQQQPNEETRPVAYVSRSMTSTEQRYAQIEKEALALTWACERFSDYLVGLPFQLETDHKPLVPLFATKLLDELPIRVQRFRLRMMRFSFSISHVPGKDLTTADTLSRAPVLESTPEDQLLHDEACAYIQYTMQNLPATEKRLSEIREEQEKDEVCKELVIYCHEGWPDKSQLYGVIKKYYSVAAELSVQDGILLRGSRLVIPASLQQEILKQVHEGHQGIQKCRERARQSIWWPGLSKQLQDLVTNCTTCCKFRSQRAEPLLPTTLPDLPWQKVGTDLFEWKKSNYLLLVDYYSRWIEIARIERTTADCVISHTSSIFARHGIPEVIISDNGPQFASESYSRFAKDYGFLHFTSSPYHPEGNGEAERAVQTIKNLLRKAEDPYRALLAYRSTPPDKSPDKDLQLTSVEMKGQ